MNDITACFTSCNRFDLLQRTLDSFFSLNLYPVDRILIIEDSENPQIREDILKHYGNSVELFCNEKNMGQTVSIDRLYNQVNTKYIFHCEDDWLFFNNPNFMKQSVELLESRSDIHQIWLRENKIYNGGDYLEDDILETSQGTKYRMVRSPHHVGTWQWCGLSFNPGLRRKEDYNKLFPKGYSQFKIPDKEASFTENSCGLHAMQFGYRAAILVDHAIEHIGWHMQTSHRA